MDFIANNIIEILGGTAIGAFLGGLLAMIFNRGNDRLQIDEALSSEARTLVGSLGRFRTGIGQTEGGFRTVLGLLAGAGGVGALVEDVVDDVVEEAADFLPDGMQPGRDEHSDEGHAGDQPSEDDGPSNQGDIGHLAQKLLAAVVAIPALPSVPDLSGNFEMLRANPVFSSVIDQLENLDTDGVNAMIDDFKGLVESTIGSALQDMTDGDGLASPLEPETLETLARGVEQFLNAIGGIDGAVGGVIDMVSKILAENG